MFWRLFFIICLLLPALTARAEPRPAGDLIGAVAYYTVKPGESLFTIARAFDIGIVEAIAANPTVDIWHPAADTTLVLPTAHLMPAVKREGIIINIPLLRLFYFPDPNTVITYPISTGKEGWSTPAGQTAIIDKRAHAPWIVPESIRIEDPSLPAVIPAGPDNPLGEYVLNLGWPGFLIHGTNRPKTVGKWASHGCIRLFPEDIEALYNAVKIGTPVNIINMPYTMGWDHGTLYLQVLPVRAQVYEMLDRKQPTFIDIPAVYGDVKQVAGADASIDWPAVDRAIRRRSGLPEPIARKIK